MLDGGHLSETVVVASHVFPLLPATLEVHHESCTSIPIELPHGCLLHAIHLVVVGRHIAFVSQPLKNARVAAIGMMIADPGIEVLATCSYNNLSATSGGVPANKSPSFVLAYSRATSLQCTLGESRVPLLTLTHLTRVSFISGSRSASSRGTLL